MLQRFGIGTPDKALRDLAEHMLAGKKELATAELLAHFHVFYRDATQADRNAKEVRVPPPHVASPS